MERVSAEEVRNAIIDYTITRFSLHTCGSCHKPLDYIFVDDTVSLLDACGGVCDLACVSSYAGVATSFNRLDPKDRAVKWDQFLRSGDPTDRTGFNTPIHRTVVAAQAAVGVPEEV
jgi:hypothetical protein